jgi:4-oxalocrotonate tautomerase
MHVTPGRGAGNLVARHRPHPSQRKDVTNVPFANLKVPAGTLTADQKRQLVDAVTDLYVDIYGERARPNVMVLVDEVIDGGWGMGGQILTKAMLES